MFLSHIKLRSCEPDDNHFSHVNVEGVTSYKSVAGESTGNCSESEMETESLDQGDTM